MRLFTKLQSLLLLSLVSGCQPFSPASGPSTLPSAHPTPTPVATSITVPVPTATAAWAAPLLFEDCPQDSQLYYPNDLVVSENGEQIYLSSRFNAHIYRIQAGKAEPLKNKAGQCLGAYIDQFERNTEQEWLFLKEWQFENGSKGARIYSAKTDLSEVKLKAEYNSHDIPEPQATPPGRYSLRARSLTANQNQIFFIWEKTQDADQLRFSPHILRISQTNSLSSFWQDANLSSPTGFAFDEKLNRGYILTELSESRPIETSQGIQKKYLSNSELYPVFSELRIHPQTRDLIILDKNRVVRMNPETQAITTIAGNQEISDFKDGKAEDARFTQPFALETDGLGNIYVLDRTPAIRKITPDGTVSTLYRAPTPSATP